MIPTQTVHEDWEVSARQDATVANNEQMWEIKIEFWAPLHQHAGQKSADNHFDAVVHSDYAITHKSPAWIIYIDSRYVESLHSE